MVLREKKNNALKIAGVGGGGGPKRKSIMVFSASANWEAQDS